MPEQDDEGRGFLRFRRSAIDRIVSDRDQMVRQAEADAEQARERAHRLESEVARLRSVLTAQTSGGHASDDPRAEALQGLIGKVLTAAEEAAGKIVDESLSESEDRLHRAEALWEEVRGELQRLASWRDRVDPAMREVRARLDEVRNAVGEIPDRIGQALAPLSRAVSDADEAVARLAQVGQPPLVVAPGLLADDAYEDEDASSPADRAENS